MPVDCIPLSAYFQAAIKPAAIVALHQGRFVNHAEFHNAVKCRVDRLRAQPQQNYALYTEDAFPFAVLFMALLYADKRIWIPGNNRPGTAELLLENHCQLIGDWGGNQSFAEDVTLTVDDRIVNLSAINPLNERIVIFTSGSTSEPKAIPKTLQQFQNEVNTLENLWGNTLADAEILATVNHQHIYGLLFRILWPLSAQRCFHSSIYLNPEMLANHATRKACWVASPAHLKRLKEDSPWQTLSRLTNIFSSGGALPVEARQQIFTHAGQQVIEIYGSSETGGIGWRQQEGVWTLFDGLSLSNDNEQSRLTSPYLPDNINYPLDDKLTLLGEHRFALHGRADRIVKVEEKRLSLTEMEHRLQILPWVQEAAAFLIPKQRDVIAVVIAVNQDDFRQLAKTRQHLIKQLRETLQPWFEPVVLPRKWLFVNRLPLTTQGKLDTIMLTTMLTYDESKYPQPLNLAISQSNVQLGIKISPNLSYFPDHFINFPILPGVVQLAWVEYFAKLFFGETLFLNRFYHLEKIKFNQIIRPGDELILSLDWNTGSGALSFSFASLKGPCSSGRMMYKINEGALLT